MSRASTIYGQSGKQEAGGGTGSVQWVVLRDLFSRTRRDGARRGLGTGTVQWVVIVVVSSRAGLRLA